jgi:hypothetical protein
MTTALYVRVIFLLKSVLGAHFVNVRLWAGKMNTSSACAFSSYFQSSSVQQRPFLKQIMQYCQVIHILSNRIDPGSKHYN